jgi:hypothetical protein
LAGALVGSSGNVIAIGSPGVDNSCFIANIRGYFTMPYSYLLTDNLSDDFWTIPLVR